MGINVEDIFISSRLNPDINITNFIEPYFYSKYLPYLEFRIADHCNMNCSACAEFSGLVEEKKFPVFENFAKDMERLSNFIDDIWQIRILGGEPLLNPEINRYIELTRKFYPQALIHVVTNGLILDKMPEDFFNTLRKNNVTVVISLYKPLENRILDIINFLEERNITYMVNPYSPDPKKPIEKFFKNQSLLPKNDPIRMFWNCNSNTCRDLWQGKITTCYKVSAIKFFNDYFNKNIPTDCGFLDLYSEDLTTEKIKRLMVTPFELCRYCTAYTWVDWKRIELPSPITDWINDT